MKRQMVDGESPENTVRVTGCLLFMETPHLFFCSWIKCMPAKGWAQDVVWLVPTAFCSRSYHSSSINCRKNWLIIKCSDIFTKINYKHLHTNTKSQQQWCHECFTCSISLVRMTRGMERCRVEKWQKYYFHESFLTELPPDLHLTVTFPGRSFPQLKELTIA